MNRILILIKRILVYFYIRIIWLFEYLYGFIFRNKLIQKSEEKKIFLLGTPEHDNIGDHAIALAELKFIYTFFPNYSIVEISVEHWRKYYFALIKTASSDDFFFFTGGGNMGNIYLPDELLRRKIISKFPHNKMIVFPQTVCFSNNKVGLKESYKSRVAYEKNNRLILCAREQESFETMKMLFPNCKVMLSPDIVFFLGNDFVPNKTKTGKIGVCIRNDHESILTSNEREHISNILKEYNIEYFSTCSDNNISKLEREKSVYNKLEQISNYDLIITDRLHAMIFSILTSTPSIVMPVKSPKISSTISWIKNIGYVTYLNNIDDFSSQLINKSMSSELIAPYDRDIFYCYFESIAKTILEL